MSIDRDIYVVAGYDLTRYKTDEFKDWRWSDDGERLMCGRSDMKVWLIEDCKGTKLHLGHIFAKGDDYGLKEADFTTDDVIAAKDGVDKELNDLIKAGVVNLGKDKPQYKIFVIDKWS